MKRLLLTAAAGLMIAGPLSLPAFAQQGYQRQDGYQYRQDDRAQQGYQDQRYQDQGQQGRDYNRDSDRDWRDGDDRNDRDRGQRRASKYHGKHDKWRETRRSARWNDNDYNGYYIGRDWHRGQPNARDYNQRGFALGYQPWQRGDRLGSYNNRYREVDYRDYGMQRPPQGYRWVKDDNNDLILAAVVGGLIAAIISNNY
jgi:Ni/Co efflux regulator RcnB